ncbi:ribonuclease H1 domain-containing protein [Listeria booriae]|uniref:ribonuclease H1 domain-containing protein n=1 Tax=Listeria booriae TaxID=1552123 RepID=UPI001628E81F|nr:ribonuclease H family protein [Listeria booriae]MBC1233559.1 reverse transcriptase-like protein [Listeria booriae]MBC1245879.1 reverse transcriptase-like protein [Listeria booriae]MBC1273370.1 reverse transcriptase-like protein [Listeria booriae]
MTKYYAVKEGKKLGIFNTWEETKELVAGYPKAQFKKFDSKAEAEAYLAEDGKTNVMFQGIEMFGADELVIFVDGSFHEKRQQYGYAFVVVQNGKVLAKKFGGAANPEYISSKQVAGETIAVLQALGWLDRFEYKEATIIYDYEGIEKWITGEWRSKQLVALNYVGLVQAYIKKGIKIHFQKIKSHSKNEFNDLADSLAKRGAATMKVVK